ncbi:cupin domain-containing protein [Chitinophagaceae bacterium LB-8]|uniref:Cupin domain-containing protein n=1 Tax=Paraflavisolibacter caeni TaxID=2982496 RepID=A0A9X2XTI8_9BACT|nr:cupin domain-containing protein [Paraflavisolibacter caeni]MCU7548550.1 cupin domain-containing protein [Paraflavisolibacter caeni]
MTVRQMVQLLDLQPHPEGGYYKEVYRSEGFVEKACLPGNFGGKRNFSTSIYYLLQKEDFSAFHRIKSDEIWHFYLGGNLLIHVLHPDGSYECMILGNTIGSGAAFQLVVPAGSWFAAEPAPGNEFTLAGCTVAPGFDFADFELADQKNLVQQYPHYQELITRLCR